MGNYVKIILLIIGLLTLKESNNVEIIHFL